MAISYTYTTLRTELQRWLEDSFDDFVTSLDDIIGKAELRCLRDLDLELFDTTDTSLSTVADTSTLALPTDTIVLRSLYVNDVLVLPRAESYVHYYDSLVANGQPLYWCQPTETTALLAPTPDAIYTTRQRIMKRPDGLSDSNAETFLSKHAGDLLFAAARAMAESFDKAPEDQALAEAEYQQILPRAQRELRMLGRVDYP